MTYRISICISTTSWISLLIPSSTPLPSGKESEERIQGQTQMYAMQLHLRESELSRPAKPDQPAFSLQYAGMYALHRPVLSKPGDRHHLHCHGGYFPLFHQGALAGDTGARNRHHQKYLSIIDIRFDNRFEADFDLAPETLNCVVPKMTLQPIVENAIYHGLEPRKAQRGICGFFRECTTICSS